MELTTVNTTTPAVITLVRMRQLSRSVDKLAGLNARIAKLQAEAELIKADLKGSGMSEIVGQKHRAVISVRNRCSLDAEKVKALLTPKQIASCTSTSTSTSLSLYDL